jgi:hypothetical protein
VNRLFSKEQITPLVHFLSKATLVTLFVTPLVVFGSANAQEFVLDRQEGTCSQLTAFVNRNGVADAMGSRHPGHWDGLSSVR